MKMIEAPWVGDDGSRLGKREERPVKFVCECCGKPIYEDDYDYERYDGDVLCSKCYESVVPVITQAVEDLINAGVK